jgi:hypothetical protein
MTGIRSGPRHSGSCRSSDERRGVGGHGCRRRRCPRDGDAPDGITSKRTRDHRYGSESAAMGWVAPVRALAAMLAPPPPRDMPALRSRMLGGARDRVSIGLELASGAPEDCRETDFASASTHGRWRGAGKRRRKEPPSERGASSAARGEGSVSRGKCCANNLYSSCSSRRGSKFTEDQT